MTEFEQQLAQALERREPPAGFTSRVLAAASQQPTRSRWQAWRWAFVLRAGAGDGGSAGCCGRSPLSELRTY